MSDAVFKKWLAVITFSGSFPYKFTQGNLVSSLRISFLVIFIGSLLDGFHCYKYIICASGRRTECTILFLVPLYTMCLTIGNIVAFIYKRKTIISSVALTKKILDVVSQSSFEVPVFLKILFVINVAVCFIGIASGAFASNDLLTNVFGIMWSVHYCHFNGIFFSFSLLVHHYGQCAFEMHKLLSKSARNKREHSIKRCILLYDRLIDLSGTMNGCFSVQLLMILILYVIIGISNLLGLIEGRFIKYGITFTGLMATYIIQQVVGLITVFTSCETASAKAKLLNHFLSDIALQHTNGICQKNPLLTIHFMIRKKLAFATYGGIGLDFRLFLTLIASCITYLMIIIQFNGGSRNASLGVFYHKATTNHT